MNNIPANSLIDNYLPADYMDSYSTEVTCSRVITPQEFRDFTFSRLPGWIDRLMRLRNAIVKPLGLDTKSKFTEMIHGENANEIIFGMPDKHLTFYVSMCCGEYKENKQELRITTVVKYNNWLGKTYFFIIRPFHGVIIQSLLNRIHTDMENNK